jgi:hypothetical protein
MKMQYIELSDAPLTYAGFINALHFFRFLWTQEDFWAKSNTERTEMVWALVHDFNRMEGTLDEVATAGVGMQGAVMEYKLRRKLMLADGKTT